MVPDQSDGVLQGIQELNGTTLQSKGCVVDFQGHLQLLLLRSLGKRPWHWTILRDIITFT